MRGGYSRALNPQPFHVVYFLPRSSELEARVRSGVAALGLLMALSTRMFLILCFASVKYETHLLMSLGKP